MLILLCVTVIVFVVLRALPADPIGMMTPPGASDADIQALQQSLGLDKALPVQFVVWLQHALQGQFGNSIQSMTPVLWMLATALPVTLQLVALSLAFGTAAGAAGAIYAFRRRGRPSEAAAELANGIAISIPDFLWGILLMLVFGVGLHWLPFMTKSRSRKACSDISI
ncbi:ABC transporter permease [Paraburkholderia graminis]|uniref:ABC transporter permease n=1 Tax=Paraburkholderia graminis TaxID=60548 RepID=UPI0012906A53|nr:ABC transporter permease [Paraburkholderia graminis]